jgi:hypothetical protein
MDIVNFGLNTVDVDSSQLIGLITNPAYPSLVEQVNIYIQQVEIDIAKIKDYINDLPKV